MHMWICLVILFFQKEKVEIILDRLVSPYHTFLQIHFFRISPAALSHDAELNDWILPFNNPIINEITKKKKSIRESSTPAHTL